MKLLPLRKIVLHTRLTPVECIERLNENTTPWSLDHMFKRDPKGRLFVGRVYHNRFDIRHVIEYNNSFIPIAHGVLTPIDSGTEVAIDFKPHRVAMWFAYIWLIIALAGMAAIIVVGLPDAGFAKEMLILPSTFVVVTTVIHTSVKAEYENSKKLLMDLLKSPRSQLK